LSRGETSQQHEWFFVLLFSAVLLAMGLGMLAISGQVASRPATRTAVPTTTVGGILFYVELGGPVLAITWAGAAVLCGPAEERDLVP
jgi:hypothetical protein